MKKIPASGILKVILVISIILNIVAACYLFCPKKAPEWLNEKISEDAASKDGYNSAFMQKAMDIAMENAETGNGPVGAVIVKDGQIIASAGNGMHESHECFQHAEICAIREAEKALAKMYLKGCEIYTSAQPCVLCETAIYDAKISKVYYAASVAETSKFEEFEDLAEYETIYAGKNLVPSVGIQIENPTEAIELWKAARSASSK